LWSLLQRSWARLHDLTPEAIAEAREMAERALAMEPDSARANFLVGCTLFHEAFMMFRSDYEPAMKSAQIYAERSIALDDNDEHAHWSLGGIYMALGQLEAAIAEYERTLEINPNWSLGWSDLGETQCYAGQAEEGLAKIEAAMRMNPRDPSMFFRFGAMAIGHYFLNDFDAAERWARKTVQRRRQYFFGHVLLVASLVRLGRIAEAHSSASDLLKLFPEFTISELQRVIFAAPAFERLSADLRAAGVPG
jgi:tetratricopeptide (TPR) repeat protein